MLEILTSGTVIFDRFQIEKEGRFGAGQSFGYRAIDLQAPEDKPWLREVFVKQYRDLIIGSDEANAFPRFYEALRQRLAQCEQYVCMPLFIGETHKSVVSVYRWVGGSTLRDRMKQGMSHGEFVRVAHALAKTVIRLHRAGVAHLDLKPSNVVVYNNRRTKKIYIEVIDFDAARIDNVGIHRRVIGTPYYTSPEHHYPSRFGDVSTKSDIFTLGIMLFELLFRCHPFGDAADYKQSIADEAFVIPESAPKYHKDIVHRVVQCLSADPARRPSAGKVFSALFNHCDSSLDGVNGGELYTPGMDENIYVKLTGSSPSGVPFQRIFYGDAGTVDLDRNQLRGSGVAVTRRSPLRLVFDGSGCLIVLLDTSLNASLDGKKLRTGDYKRLRDEHELRIGDVSFTVQSRKYLDAGIYDSVSAEPSIDLVSVVTHE